MYGDYMPCMWDPKAFQYFLDSDEHYVMNQLDW